MKSKYRLLKVLLIVLAFVACGVIYTLVSSAGKKAESSAEDAAKLQEESSGTETVHEQDIIAADVSGNAAPDPERIVGSISSKTANIETPVCVHVCGAVNDPGVYYLASTCRVHQAVECAGGLREDAAEEYINLANVIYDGQQIYIPTRQEVSEDNIPNVPAFDSESTKTGQHGDDGLININTASLSELASLPGIGESKAQAIITYRENVSLFYSISDITNVSGIKDSSFEKIKDYIKV